jgi:hypothetical protein
MIEFLTLITFVGFIIFIYFNIEDMYTIKFFFIFSWFFYNMAVPIDLSLGLQIKVLENLVDLNNNESLVIKVMILAYLALLGFLVSYYMTFTFKHRVYKNNKRSKSKISIPIRAIMLINIIFIILYILNYLGIDRQQLSLEVNSNISSKLFFISLLLLKGLNLFYIFNNKKNFTKTLLITMLILPILQGSRIEIILYLIAYLMIKDIKFSFFTFLFLFMMFLFMMFVWKIMYAILFYQVDDLSIFDINTNYGLSSIEFLPSFAIAAEYIQSYDYGVIGKTYLHVINEFFPAIIYNLDYLSLTSEMTSHYTPIMYSLGGSIAFSFLAESWYNFGKLGPFIIAAIVGFLSAIADAKQKKNLILLVMIFIMLRLWRTEFSLLFKQTLIIFETYFIWYLFFYIIGSYKSMMLRRKL